MPTRHMEERLARLEREIEQMRERIIEATEFRIVDRDGVVRGSLAMTRKGPRLAFFAEDGTVRAEMLLTREGPGMTFADEGGDTRAWMGVTKNAARLGMADEQGNQRAFLGVGSKGPHLDFYDRKQRSIWSAPGGTGHTRGAGERGV